MRNGDRFFEAFAHSTHKVMGRKLKPLRLHHQFWLEAMGSPLVGGGGSVSLVDLEMACRICACDYGSETKALERGIGRWCNWRGWLFAVRCLVYSPAREMAKFVAYLDDHKSSPSRHVEEPTQTKDGRVYEDFPGIMDQVCALIRATGWGKRDVWTMGVGEADWYMVGIYRLRGVDMKVKTQQEEEFEEGMAAAKAEKESVDTPSEVSNV